MTIKAVVFDLGAVLIDWDPERAYDRLIGPERRKALFSQVDLYSMNLRIDKGQDFRATVYELAEAHPAWSTEIRIWHDGWSDFLQGPISATVRSQAALREKGVPLYALTNFGVDTLAIAQSRFPFLGHFDKRFVSGDLRCIKPDAEIYQALESGVPEAPEQLLFTDDKPENIAAADARGWQTHLFDGPEGWIARLKAENLIEGDLA